MCPLAVSLLIDANECPRRNSADAQEKCPVARRSIRHGKVDLIITGDRRKTDVCRIYWNAFIRGGQTHKCHANKLGANPSSAGYVGPRSTAKIEIRSPGFGMWVSCVPGLPSGVPSANTPAA